MDWSKRLTVLTNTECLDSQAIASAREKYKAKKDRVYISESVDSMTDAEFLTKLRLMYDGKLTNAAILLLGRPEYTYIYENPPAMMWRLYGSEGEVRDYQIFEVPFIHVVDKILEKIRFYNYRYLPNRKSLFPKETVQYNTWIVRELLNNCIAHSDYQLGGRIYVNEFEHTLTITNPGAFIPESIQSVLQPDYHPPYYRNLLLVSAMTNFGMMDTASSGIPTIFRLEQSRYFPMPEYDMSRHYQVEGKRKVGG